MMEFNENLYVWDSVVQQKFEQLPESQMGATSSQQYAKMLQCRHEHS